MTLTEILDEAIELADVTDETCAYHYLLAQLFRLTGR